MHKTIPIRLERVSRTNVKVIEIRLGSTCNYKCSFCDPVFNDGKRKPLSLETYKGIVDRLTAEAPGPVWFQFTGGEPTLYPNLIELLSYVKQKGGYTSLLSNGSRTTRWWLDLIEANALDRLFLTHHPEQNEDLQHICVVNDLMQNTIQTLVTVFVTAIPELFDKAVADHRTILSEAASIASLKPITDADGLCSRYTDQQLEIMQVNTSVSSDRFKRMLKKHLYWKNVPWYASNMLLVFEDGSSRIDKPHIFIERKEANFKGWSCDIGQDILVLDTDVVYRGVCHVGGGKPVSSDWSWETTPVTCTRNSCVCGLDIQAEKRRT